MKHSAPWNSSGLASISMCREAKNSLQTYCLIVKGKFAEQFSLWTCRVSVFLFPNLKSSLETIHSNPENQYQYREFVLFHCVFFSCTPATCFSVDICGYSCSLKTVIKTHYTLLVFTGQSSPVAAWLALFVPVSYRPVSSAPCVLTFPEPSERKDV